MIGMDIGDDQQIGFGQAIIVARSRIDVDGPASCFEQHGRVLNGCQPNGAGGSGKLLGLPGLCET